ncbi:MAG TPA: TonB-dependent receptor [Cyclobacteriaceae bacterium]|nr:TonB-dependent receptor [Cyclobacteriaceae bacterium]
MFKLIATVVSCVLSLHALAQYKISGTVRDSKTNHPLVGATILLEDGHGTTTDEQGYYELKNVVNGRHTLVARFLGFAEEKKEVDFGPTTGAASLYQQATVDFALTESAQLTDEIVVYATRAKDNSPTAFSNISKTTIQKQNFGQDMPFVLNWTPSLVTTSDAGAGIGYTGVRIRGSDATRINVTINGIVLNDAEEQGVYWVDIPDIATSTQNIQIQRGVGTSTNGAGAFGASINLQTNTRRDQPYADVINSFGSFGTHRHTVGFGTGLKNKFAFDGRMSLIGSDGYVDRATSDLKSYYLSGGYYGDKTMIKAIVFGGKEVTYQSWYGVPQSRLNNDPAAMQATIDAEGWNAQQAQNLLSSGRTFNAYTYPNQTDNYAQDHYQLHLSHQVNDKLTASGALHYTYGRGYYEEYKYNQTLSDYGISNPVIGTDTVATSDLVRRLWLDNRFYGMTWSLNYQKEKWNSVLGGAWNKYDGDHYGEVIWSQVATTIPPVYRYYFNNGKKTDFNIFWKNSLELAEKLYGFVDLQYRRVNYNAKGLEDGGVNVDFDVNYNFFNPKLGLTYSLTADQQLYGSYSVGNREPVRSDFVQSIAGQQPQHETLHDVEVGWRVRKNKVALNINYYFMDYQNQLVLTGKLNNVGSPIRTNVAASYRTGIEIDGGIRFNEHFTWNANLTLSQNKIKDFTEVLYDYGANYDQYNEVERNHKNTDISFSPNVIAGSMFLYKPIKNVEVGLLTKYVGLQYLDNASDKSRSIDPYFINDLRLTYSLQPRWMREFSISLLMNNFTDVKYASNGYTWGYLGGGTETRQNYYYPQAGRSYLLMVAMRF